MKREIFVFGSNRAGRHGKGAALFARQNYGAIYGRGEAIGWTFEFLGYDGEWGRAFAFLNQGEPANGTGAIVRNVIPVRRAF